MIILNHSLSLFSSCVDCERSVVLIGFRVFGAALLSTDRPSGMI